MKRMRRIESLVPPGYDEAREVRLFWVALAVAVLLSLLTLTEIRYAYNALFELVDNDVRVLREGARMKPFGEVIAWTPVLFLSIMVMALSHIAVHRAALTRESRALDLLRRLPTRGEVFRRVAALPLLGAGVTLAVALLVYGLYFLYYLWITPAGCLPY